MNKLKIITSTTREGAKGIHIAKWITELAKTYSDFEVELVDLQELDLPMMNEPNHPSLGDYKYEHTKNWSKTVSEADAFIIVLAEYNYGFPAPIKNAIDYLFKEWGHKPVGFVSYGGISAGLRATQMLKQVVTTLNMMPISEQVNLPVFSKDLKEDGTFAPDQRVNDSAKAMLSELARWSKAMKSLRA